MLTPSECNPHPFIAASLISSITRSMVTYFLFPFATHVDESTGGNADMTETAMDKDGVLAKNKLL
jgi:hypothetical protein